MSHEIDRSVRVRAAGGRRSALIIAALSMLLVAALLCGAGAVAVRRGSLNPPAFELNLGAARLVGSTSVFPLCPRFTPCLLEQANEVARIYTIWLLEPPTVAGGSPTITRIVSLPLDDSFSTIP